MQADTVKRGSTPPEDTTRTAPSNVYGSPRSNHERNFSFDQGPGPATIESTPPPRTRLRKRTMQRAQTSAQAADTDRPDPLTIEETTALFQKKLNEAREHAQKALDGPEEVTEVIKPTLTIDLGHSSIERLPTEVISLIMADVERLSLSHNRLSMLPPELAECTQLRYLNIRSNEFTFIPDCIYEMPFLEILDVSKNGITHISPNIRKMSALRVFSLVGNNIKVLPFQLADLPRLKVLKVGGNSFTEAVKRVIRNKEQEIAYSVMSENEKDTAMTTEVLNYLRKLRTPQRTTPVLEDGDIREPISAIELPRPQRRALSGRFPVVPAAMSSENLVASLDGASPPSLPVKSHLRGLSGQMSQSSIKRPGIAPLVNGNERNRSNSESVVQASMMRQKRMGVVKRAPLDSIDETNTVKQNHFRGMSHGSVLRRGGSISSPGAGSSSPASPRDARKERAQQFVRRLSSLPEQKNDLMRRPLIEGAKGILYALYQVTPNIHGLLGPIRGISSHRSQLEMAVYAASATLDKLNKSLERAEDLDPEDAESWAKHEDVIYNDCAVSLRTFMHVITQMQEATRKIVAGAEPRYVRTLMLMIYGSIIEVKNAIKSFGIDVKQHRRQMSSGTTHHIATIPEEPISEAAPNPEETEEEFDGLTLKQSSRSRSDTVVKNPQNPPLQPVQPPALRIPANQYPNIPAHFIAPPRSSSAMSYTSNRSFATRSRSQSRTTNIQTPSLASSVSSTPRSVESMSLPPALATNGIDMTTAQEEQQFMLVFMALTKAYETALRAVPITIQALERCLEAASQQQQARNVIDIWTGLVTRSKLCYDMSQALQLRLTSMRVKDSGVGLNSAEGGRHDPSFWVLCKTFLSNFVGLLTEMKTVRKSRMIILPQEAIAVLRPVQKACQEAGHSITTSPWNHLLEGVQPMPAPTPMINGSKQMMSRPQYNRSATVANSNVASYSSALAALQNNQIGNGQYAPNSKVQLAPPTLSTSLAGSPTIGTPSGISSHSPMSGSSSIPATPLTAALGAAAQATVPSTPASLYSDSFFKGDVFQRADSLMNMPQAAGVNFLGRR